MGRVSQVPPTGWVKTRHLSDHEDPNRATYHVPSGLGGNFTVAVCFLTKYPPDKLTVRTRKWIPLEYGILVSFWQVRPIFRCELLVSGRVPIKISGSEMI